MLVEKRILITGGAGFIGSTLVGRLVDRNQVVVYDNFARNALATCEYRAHPNLRLVEGNVLDADHVERAIRAADPTHVIHCAAIAGIDTVIVSPVRTMRVNMMGTANVLAAVTSLHSLERVVCFSTSEVFGRQAFMSAEGDSAVIGRVGEARWTYAVSKLAGEHLAVGYYKEMKVPVTVLRPFNVYGPGQVGEGALSTFIQRAIAGEEIQIHGDGTQIRAWCYVDDMVRGVLLALSSPRAVGETFNIGNQKAVLTIYGLANTVVRVLGSSSPIRFVQKDYADIELRVPDTRKAKDHLGFEAEIDLDQGITRTAEYFRAKARGAA